MLVVFQCKVILDLLYHLLYHRPALYQHLLLVESWCPLPLILNHWCYLHNKQHSLYNLQLFQPYKPLRRSTALHYQLTPFHHQPKPSRPSSFRSILMLSSQNMEDHVAHLKLVFEVLVQYKAFSTTNKFSFAKPNIEYLGHII